MLALRRLNFSNTPTVESREWEPLAANNDGLGWAQALRLANEFLHFSTKAVAFSPPPTAEKPLHFTSRDACDEGAAVWNGDFPTHLKHFICVIEEPRGGTMTSMACNSLSLARSLLATVRDSSRGTLLKTAHR